MLSSIRIRLTLWYAGALAMLLALTALVFYIAVDRIVHDLADDSIEDAATALVETLRAQKRLSDEMVLTDETIREALEDYRFQFIVFAVFEEDFRPVAVSPRLTAGSSDRLQPFNLEAGDIPKEKVLEIVGEDDEGFLTIEAAGDPEVRIYVRRAQFEGRPLLVTAIRPLRSQMALLGYVRLFFAGFLPVALILSSVGGYYLAGKSLRPVGEMAEKAALITESSLSERVPRGKAEDELGELADAFNGMLVRLESAFEQQKRFMADASHELRTPLAIIRGESEVSLQKDERSEEEYRESLDVIRLEVSRLSRIVEDLFILAKTDAGGFVPRSTTFYLDEVVSECARAIRTLVEKKDLGLEMDIEEGMVFKGDEALIRRLILNLLDNAVKYSHPGGVVAISCVSRNGYYMIDVSNTGHPIPDEDKDHVFDRFFRTDKARSHTADYAHGTGAGLGLAIGSSIASIHGGRLELLSSDEELTTFRAILPVQRS